MHIFAVLAYVCQQKESEASLVNQIFKLLKGIYKLELVHNSSGIFWKKCVSIHEWDTGRSRWLTNFFRAVKWSVSYSHYSQKMDCSLIHSLLCPFHIEVEVEYIKCGVVPFILLPILQRFTPILTHPHKKTSHHLLVHVSIHM